MGLGLIINLTGILISCKTFQNLALKGVLMKNTNYHKLNASKIICKQGRRFIPTKRKGGDVPRGCCRNFWSCLIWWNSKEIFLRCLFATERRPCPQLSLLLYWCLSV